MSRDRSAWSLAAATFTSLPSRTPADPRMTLGGPALLLAPVMALLPAAVAVLVVGLATWLTLPATPAAVLTVTGLVLATSGRQLVDLARTVGEVTQPVGELTRQVGEVTPQVVGEGAADDGGTRHQALATAAVVLVLLAQVAAVAAMLWTDTAWWWVLAGVLLARVPLLVAYRPGVAASAVGLVVVGVLVGGSALLGLPWWPALVALVGAALPVWWLLRVLAERRGVLEASAAGAIVELGQAGALTALAMLLHRLPL